VELTGGKKHEVPGILHDAYIDRFPQALRRHRVVAVFDADILEERLRRLTAQPAANSKRARLLLVTGLSALALCVVIASGLVLTARAQSGAHSEMTQAGDAYNSGDFKSAVQHFEKAAKLEPANINAKLFLANALIREFFGEGAKPDSILMASARQQYQEALDIRQKMGEMDLVAENQLSLAELALEEAHPEQAESLLQPAIAEFEKEKADPDSTGAYIALSRAMLAENKVDQARKAIQRAVELTRHSPDPALKFPTAIQSARIEIASAGRGAAANAALAGTRQRLRSILADARKLGYYNLQCEARLALGELELKANPSLGRSMLKQLADDASARGLQLISSKARS